MEGVIGYTTMFAGNFAPKNWAFCQGQIINIASNTALFSILGTVYGGNGTTTFGLPDLRGRTIVGVGQGPGLSQYSLGQAAGTETQTLNQLTMPAHVHPVAVVAANPSTDEPANLSTASGNVYGRDVNSPQLFPYAGGPNVNMGVLQGALTMTAVGANQSFSILRPLLGMNYIICLRGVYPARN
jgi:microcystin-dependent protein